MTTEQANQDADAPETVMTFEQAMAALETIVRRLESGEVPLEESIRAYEHGMRLKRRCERTLADAQLRVERIAVDGDGGVGVVPAALG